MLKNTAYESFNTIVLIFMQGPLKIWLEVKEGKTSLKKMVDDYNDERNILHEKLGVKKPELLPTGQGTVKRKTQGEGKDKSEMY